MKQNEVNIPESKRVRLTNDCEKVLNKDIDSKEFLNIVKRLKSKKAVTLDLISNEIIKFSTSTFKNALIKLFNLILKSNHILKGWSQGLITPVHKKGDKLNPDNCRGICITSCLGKVFFLILNDRLSKVVNKNRIIHDSQIGFKKGFRTTDHLFTLKSLLHRHVIQQLKGKVYACFVDLKKAYDTVWHENLFMRLSGYGIDGNFLFILKKIYQQTKCAVKIGSKYTQFFEYKRGLRQGCPLSHILFNLYINDLAFALNAINPTPLKLNDMIEISCLFYADDIVILSSSPEGLQKCIECLEKFCKSKALEVNTTKTKCMVFQKKSRKYTKHQFRINNKVLDNVTEFTYLGITINAGCSFKPTIQTLSEKAMKAIFVLNNKFKFSKMPLNVAMKLFDACIMLVLIYGSEIWGDMFNSDIVKWDSLDTEKVHLQFCKHILGVNRSTMNNMVSSIEHGGTRPFFYMVDQYFGNDSLEHFESKFIGSTGLSMVYLWLSWPSLMRGYETIFQYVGIFIKTIVWNFYEVFR